MNGEGPLECACEWNDSPRLGAHNKARARPVQGLNATGNHRDQKSRGSSQKSGTHPLDCAEHGPFTFSSPRRRNGISNFHRTSKRTVKRVEWSERVGRDSRAERGRMLGSDSAESDENESERASTVRAYGIGEGNETKEKDRTSSAG